MTRAGWALRDKWQMEAAAAKTCTCGHPMGGHFERRPTYELVLDADGNMTGEVVEHRAEDYKVGRFFCDCAVDR